jgi:hypothetical protein
MPLWLNPGIFFLHHLLASSTSKLIQHNQQHPFSLTLPNKKEETTMEIIIEKKGAVWMCIKKE